MEWVRECMVLLEEKNYSWVASLSAIDFLENNLWEADRFPIHLKNHLWCFPAHDFCSEAGEGLIPDFFELHQGGFFQRDAELQALRDLLSRVLTFEDVDLNDKTQYLLSRKNDAIAVSQHLTMGMSPKKKHEVVIMSGIFDSLLSGPIDKIVELGCGHGYLSSFLALSGQRNNRSILGIDLSELNCLAASKRHFKISRAKAFKATAEHVNINFRPGYFSENSPRGLYDGEEDRWSIWTSLHGCGNLSVSMIRKWAQEETAKILLQVGCCYHRLDVPGNFPLSRHFCEIKLTKGHLNSACQAPPERRISHKEMLLHYYGALFHVFFAVFLALGLFDSSSLPFLGSMKAVPVHLGFGAFARAIFGHERKPFQGGEKFKNLTDACFNAILPELQSSDAFRKLSLLFAIQRLLGPCYEMLILADRVQWLRELGYIGSLIRIFDRKVSPRSYLVSAYKQQLYSSQLSY
ncbi:hypothetical protein DI09_8p150 [Mitosporidium daphniae]|uniref:Methyltransferase domain-containing protein n=1 Tax=Mitosporidium daphniae TaxID=1485682 RepID=A0A098VQR0_9MICR|nr:uncharacterized protein DI09_8p150 [Mitosporidium daphniae]KGG50076.1 hypothetical protein DI09_8p150 [Mitosporidium daphniae]|eukprot:XP_013236503.1 uncharacterized protein DI09_8p150 [Mitosporidium daphniae]